MSPEPARSFTVPAIYVTSNMFTLNRWKLPEARSSVTTCPITSEFNLSTLTNAPGPRPRIWKWCGNVSRPLQVPILPWIKPKRVPLPVRRSILKLPAMISRYWDGWPKKSAKSYPRYPLWKMCVTITSKASLRCGLPSIAKRPPFLNCRPATSALP